MLHYMGLIQDFTAKPETFLADHAVIVGDETEWNGETLGVAKFYMKKISASANVVQLVRKTGVTGPSDKECVNAYWLPWKTGTGVALDLGVATEWLFTSEMTNCRFTVLTDANDKAVKVAHLAGTMNSSTRRTKWEEDTKNKFFTDKTTQKVRRFSVSGNALQYRGNKGDQSQDSSSAFVFGHKENDEWKFYTQVVQGFRNAVTTGNPRMTANIEILTAMASI
jgi:hypothetical protein